MLSISKPLKGANAADYYLQPENSDYYVNELEDPGVWCGSGARRLGLAGEIEPNHFRHLMAGYSADGSKALVQNAGKPARQRGWDLTFSDPKSVSVLRGLGGDDVRSEIDQARSVAVREALDYAERIAGLSRRGKEGKTEERVGLVFALFNHYSSRALEPASHTHCILLNVGVREDGSTGALKTEELFRSKMKLGEIYRRVLERELVKRLEVEVTPEKHGFHIEGVPHDLCKRFSTRRREIEALLEAKGFSGATAAKVAAMATRREKVHLPKEEHFAAWTKVAEEFGWTREQIDRVTRLKPVQENKAERAQESTSSKEQEPKHEAESNQSKSSETKTSKEERTGEQNKGGAHKNADFSGYADADPGPKEESESDKAQRRKAGREKQRKAAKEKEQWWDDAKKPFVRVEWKPVIPAAPEWSPAKKMTLPVVVVGRRHPRWGSVSWSKQIGGVELRVQEKFLFPSAPGWNPLSRWSLKAARVVKHDRKQGAQKSKGWKGPEEWGREESEFFRAGPQKEREHEEERFDSAANNLHGRGRSSKSKASQRSQGHQHQH